MGGQHPTYAFWYDPALGHMVTSEYYLRTIPDWVRAFNAGDWIDRNLPPAWTKLRSEAFYSAIGTDDLKGERPWDGSTSFPHVFDAARKRNQLLVSPYGDQMILDFAREALRSE